VVENIKKKITAEAVSLFLERLFVPSKRMACAKVTKYRPILASESPRAIQKCSSPYRKELTQQ
jgi:hypothetical protein